MNFQQEYQKKLMTPQEAVGLIQEGDKIYAQSGALCPLDCVNEVYRQRDRLKKVDFLGMLVAHPYELFDPSANDTINYTTTFFGPYERAARKAGRHMDYYIYQLKNVNQVVRDVFKPTVVMFSSPGMDENGNFNLSYNPGDSDDRAREARIAIINVNKNLPYCYSDSCSINIADIDAVVEMDYEIPEGKSAMPTELDQKVASYIVERIPNGATLQIGIGGITNAVGYSLENHKHLGIHTEMFVESMYYLMEKGAVDNSLKKNYPGKSVYGFAGGSRDMMNWLDKNPDMLQKSLEWVNDPYIAGENDNFISVNACISADLMGQVASESIGPVQFSGTGGQLDFVRTAAVSKGGQSYIATSSVNVAKDGTRSSKIVFGHAPGTAITTPRTDIQFIVTEYGVADLWNKSATQRAKQMIAIAHPDFRDELTAQAKKAGYII